MTDPGEELPALGPAISPRRGSRTADPSETQEFVAPFISGIFRAMSPPAAPAQPAPREIAPVADDEDGLEPFTAEAWPDDDFAWSLGEEPAAADGTGDAVPTDTAEAEDSFAWADEPLPELARELIEADAGREATDEITSEPVAEAVVLAPEPAEPEAAEADLDAFPWERASEDEPTVEMGFLDRWNAGVSDTPPPEAATAPEIVAPVEDVVALEALDGAEWTEPGEAVAFVEELDLSGADAQSGDAIEFVPEGDFGDVTIIPDFPEAPSFAVPSGLMDAAEAEVTGEGTAAAADPALVEVADRLERIAAALRTGQPLESLSPADPLQVLITGYALGYAQARQG